MPPEEKDRAYLWDMREAARKPADLVLQTSEAEFPAAETLRFAVERLVLVLGEAAARVSDTYRSQHPEIPWSRLQRMRNIVAHTYGKKAAGELYRSCRQHLVPLSILLESLVTAPPPDDEDRAL